MFERCTDSELLSLLIYGEARGEPTTGKLAVARVAMNRAASPCWWGRSLRDVILKPKQFSCFNSNDPNSSILKGMAETGRYNLVCLAVAELALSGYTTDPTKGATHYHANSIQPPWSLQMVVTARIGRHVFLRECPAS